MRHTYGRVWLIETRAELDSRARLVRVWAPLDVIPIFSSLKGKVSLILNKRPGCHSLSCTCVRSGNTAEQYRSSYYLCISEYLFYDRVFLSRRSRVSCTSWRNLLSTAFSKILFITGSRPKGLYELASVAVFQILEPGDLRDFPLNWRISRPNSLVTFKV